MVSSVKTHLAAIAAFHEEVQGSSVFAHKLAQLLLKVLTTPPPQYPVLSFSVHCVLSVYSVQCSLLVLAGLMKPPFEP